MFTKLRYPKVNKSTKFQEKFRRTSPFLNGQEYVQWRPSVSKSDKIMLIANGQGSRRTMIGIDINALPNERQIARQGKIIGNFEK